MPLQGFIFDLDGVLTDTAEYHYQGWQRLADDLGIPFDRERNEALRGGLTPPLPGTAPGRAGLSRRADAGDDGAQEPLLSGTAQTGDAR